VKKVLWFALIFGLAANAGADSLEVTLNDFSAQLRYGHEISRDPYGSFNITSGLLYNDDEDTRLGSAGFEFLGEPGHIQGLLLGVGAQLTGGRTDDGQDLLALAVGGRGAYAPAELSGLGFFGRVSYGPRILSFFDAERMLETGVGLSYAITPNLSLVAEYQNIRTKFEDKGTRIIDEGVRGGFHARF
jgi:hypothetical protein